MTWLACLISFGPEIMEKYQRSTGVLENYKLQITGQNPLQYIWEPSCPPPATPHPSTLTSLLHPSEKLGTHSTILAMVLGSARTPQTWLLKLRGFFWLFQSCWEAAAFPAPSQLPLAQHQGFSLTALICSQQTERVLDQQHGGARTEVPLRGLSSTSSASSNRNDPSVPTND